MARPAVMLLQASRLVPFERSVPQGLQVSGELIWSRNGQLELSFGVLAAGASAQSANRQCIQGELQAHSCHVPLDSVLLY